jgi:hypothetical protein
MTAPRHFLPALTFSALAFAALGPAQAQLDTAPDVNASGATAPAPATSIYGTPSADTRVAQARTGMGMDSSSSMRTSDSYSLLPWTRRGYFGINIGDAKFKTGCGTAAFGCSNPDASLRLSTGGLFNDTLGMEIGYLYTGAASRGGGDTSAQGVDLSLVVRAPVGPFNAFLKGGAIYAQTRVTADALSGLPTGKRSGWGGKYGAGVGFDLTPTQGVVLEWSRAELQFPGADRQNFDSTSLGYVVRF